MSLLPLADVELKTGMIKGYMLYLDFSQIMWKQFEEKPSFGVKGVMN